MEKEGNSYLGRLSIKITLNKLLRIEEIHEIAKANIEKYKHEFDEIFIFVAKSGDDYLMYNWILRSLWLNPSCDRIKMFPLSQSDGTGYSWQEGDSFSVMADYNDKFVFKDDDYLFVCNQKLYKELHPIYEELLNSFTSNPFDSFLIQLFEREDKISKPSSIMGDFGKSRNKELDTFLKAYTEFSNTLDNILLWAKMDHLNDQRKKHQINKCFQELYENVEFIGVHSSKWFLEFDNTLSSLDHIDPYNIPEQPSYQFEQTIPLNPNALKVAFDLKVDQLENCSLNIMGETNLYDGANLLVSVKSKNGQLYGQTKAVVKDGKFNFGLLRYKDKGYESGDYVIEISVSIPSTQPESFRKKAGFEYENLDGIYVQRNGIAPTIKYIEEFQVI